MGFFWNTRTRRDFFFNPDGSGQGTGGPSGEGSDEGAEDKGKEKSN